MNPVGLLNKIMMQPAHKKAADSSTAIKVILVLMKARTLLDGCVSLRPVYMTRGSWNICCAVMSDLCSPTRHMQTIPQKELWDKAMFTAVSWTKGDGAAQNSPANKRKQTNARAVFETRLNGHSLTLKSIWDTELFGMLILNETSFNSWFRWFNPTIVISEW